MSNIDLKTEPDTNDRFKRRRVRIRLLLSLTQIPRGWEGSPHATGQTGSADWADYIFYGDPTFVLETPATADHRIRLGKSIAVGIRLSPPRLAQDRLQQHQSCKTFDMPAGSRSLGTEMTLACAIPLATASALHAQTSSRVSARTFNAAHPDPARSCRWARRPAHCP